MKLSPKSSRHDMLSEINMVPFIDVVLVLLIIFMLATPLLYRGLKINLPKTATNSLKKPIPKVVVSINHKGTVYVGGHKVDWQDLRPMLSAYYKKDKRVVVYLKADRKVDYGVVVHLMDIVKQAGIDRLGMITMPTPQTTE
ncbi:MULTISPECIES: ExbD/TolR family protein [Leptospirillum]|uniref:Biopolymer transporter ExbD n=5 Tax=Leptospirillum TaxID=179 RepID=A0A059XU93_9BACT|nr:MULTISPECIES: biopolymer transporter ExbD [Leptospirillum]AIA30403.1 biopolymer transporter ExbD [Leptospirillum ferriphilum YSK]AFS53383.1 putative biopolymer transport protein ExbD/TolR [Leptospirillum ferriphilum ML-04]AKS24788.1 biopolymer transporter ExbD [Leptospirillum sp. Group II 'CF-1']OOH75211.1 biopolymer transporter ExbD [Leptospirillum ferriphilum]OOH78541.1 biopolymer transporter ExbD [Leptospirillum ferriphilum]